jgi:hypothetical protein
LAFPKGERKIGEYSEQNSIAAKFENPLIEVVSYIV